jgi:hypothetical protein
MGTVGREELSDDPDRCLSVPVAVESHLGVTAGPAPHEHDRSPVKRPYVCKHSGDQPAAFLSPNEQLGSAWHVASYPCSLARLQRPA